MSPGIKAPASDQVLNKLLCLVQVHEACLTRPGLGALVPDILEVLLQVAFILFVRELFPVGENSLRELAGALLTQHLLVLDHVALLVPGLLSKLIELYFHVPRVVLRILQVVVVAQHEVLIVIEIAFTYLLNEVLEI